MAELDESDIRACGGYLPLGRAGVASGTLGETEDGTGLGSGTLDQAENGTGLAGGTLSQTEDRTGLASATRVEGSDDAARDFLEPDVDAGGDDLLRGVVIADCGEAVPSRRPPTSAFGGTSPTRDGPPFGGG
jgi:hypothetical protein